MVQVKKEQGKPVRYNFKQHVTLETQSQSMSAEDMGQLVAFGCKKKCVTTCARRARDLL